MLTDIELCNEEGWRVIFKSKEKRASVWTWHISYCFSVTKGMEDKKKSNMCNRHLMQHSWMHTRKVQRIKIYALRGILIVRIMFQKHLNIPKYRALRPQRSQRWASFMNTVSQRCVSRRLDAVNTQWNWTQIQMNFSSQYRERDDDTLLLNDKHFPLWLKNKKHWLTFRSIMTFRLCLSVFLLLIVLTNTLVDAVSADCLLH